MARCGFGEQLLALFQRRLQDDIRPFLAHWRAGVNQELHTNSRGFLRHKYPSLSLPLKFPNMEVLENYANPVCSALAGKGGSYARYRRNEHRQNSWLLRAEVRGVGTSKRHYPPFLDVDLESCGDENFTSCSTCSRRKGEE